jgi:hypothetical protein
MRKSLALFIALALSLALCTTGFSIDPMHPASAERVSAEAPAGDAPQPDAEQSHTVSHQEESPSDTAPPRAAEPTPTEKPEGGSAPGSAQEMPEETATAEPTLPPPEESAAPTAAPTQTPAQTPAGAPVDRQEAIPAETPPAPVDASAEAYRVSPAEAVYVMGSNIPLKFAIFPSGAPFLGVEGVECAYADGAVTIGAEALDALGGGEHILAFLFEEDVRVEVPLKVVAAKAAAKGSMESLIIGGKTFGPENLSQDRTETVQHWTWNAATATLTLDGYNGDRIYAWGAKALTVVTTAGSVNTVASPDGDSLYASSGLILKGGGTLNVLGDGGCAVASNGAIAIEGGTIRAGGKEYAFHSAMNEIRVSGGKVEVRREGHRGDGFASKKPTRVDGGSVAVEGAGSAFGSLAVSGGTVTVRDCEVGASGGLSASGGEITIEDVAGSAAVSGQAMRFVNCTLNIRGCGAYGLSAGGGLTAGQGADLSIEAGKIALYASGKAGTIRIEKGANLDLSGGECALRGGKVLVGGKAYTGAYNHVVIRNGAIIRKENAMQRLVAGGRTYGASSLSGDLAGGGWAWTASSRTLTLNGYGGGSVSAAGSGMTLSLAGENKIDGDLTAPGAVVTGGGSLTVSRVVGVADLEIRSGTVSAARIALGGGFTVSGGAVLLSGSGAGPAVECRNFNLLGGELTLSSPDGSQPAGIRASGSAVLRGGAATVRNFGDFLQASGDVVITGGSITIGGNTGAGITSGRTIKATGGSVSIKTALCAMTAKTIEIVGKASLRLESATRAAFSAKTVKIAGKLYAPRYPGVIVEGGRLVEGYKLLPDLIIGDREFSMKELNAGDLSGDGWSWSVKKNILTLSGYHGAGIWINRNLTVALAPGTVNSGGGEAGIYSKEDLTLIGSGRWSGGLQGEGKLKIAGSPLIFASAIRFRGGVFILGGRIEVAGNLEAEDGDVLIENGRVTAGRVRGARVELRKCSLTTTESGSAGNPDLSGGRGLTISSSIVFCTQFGAGGGNVKLSGSPVFRRGLGGGEVWALAQSASITRDMTIPPDKNCLVPAGRTLSVAKGKRLYVLGSLAVDGTLKGAAVQRSGAGGVNILGGAQVAKGRSVRLTAQVVPAVPGGQADQAVSWSSDCPKLLSVSDKGVVAATALSKPGDTANITCRALDGTGVEGMLLMTVTQPVAKLTILRGGAPVARLSAARGEGPVELDARVEPEGASNRLRWTSSNPAVTSVDPDTGTVRLLKKGTATISCAVTDGTNVTALVKLTVK